MRHRFFTAPRPLVFAHRGGSALAPENTIDAFDNGLALGADGLELDVHLSVDGVVVVHHDRSLERTTRLRGPVAARSAGELAAAGVPALSEVLTRYADARVIIEMKENRPELAAAVVDVVWRANAVERVCLGSFGRRVLRAARAIEPAIATSAAREEVRWALYRSWVRWPVMNVGYGGYQVPEWAGRTRVVSPYFVDASHRAGLAVQVWTVDDRADAARLLSWGVDALITDRPDIIVPLVKKREGTGDWGLGD
ncbi:MAG TPA: glycerophosphodiester phosphodiesterase family protein [Vicinamibacterales bacterium]|nr:glycerophosphodiester phosphodiesterase family protein [Vicinamibacterales bacterium]